MSDRGPSRILSEPRAGYFKTRMVRNGPFVSAEIRYGPGIDPDTGECMDRGYLWEALIDGKHIRNPSPDPLTAGAIRIWESAIEISEKEFRDMGDAKTWCKHNEPESPHLHPDTKVDLVDLPPSHFLPKTT